MQDILEVLDTIKCKRCELHDMLLTEQVKAQIPKFLEEIAQDMRVADAEYKARLEICFECDALAGGVMCKHCGCFVQMRALDKRRSCPSPSGGRW